MGFADIQCGGSTRSGFADGNKWANSPEEGVLELDRRDFFGLGAAAAAASAGLPAFGQVSPVDTGTVRDRLWAFCNPINADYYMVKKRSVMSPVESAIYLGIPNVMMVNQYPKTVLNPEDDDFFQPWRSPMDLHAYPTKMLKRVVWSIVGAGGKTTDAERSEILQLARKNPNFVGLMMDDFVRPGEKASLTVEQLKDIQKEIKGAGKKLDLYVTLYMASQGFRDQIKPFIFDYIKHVDMLTLWAWDHNELAKLDDHLHSLERISPKSRKMLGCYTAAFNPGGPAQWTPLPLELMRLQCETGLKWLRQGRIEGMILYANFPDLDWNSINWMRDWVKSVGDQRLRIKS